METVQKKTLRLLELLEHEEGPMGVYYSDAKPEDGFGPKPGELFSREREAAGEIDWGRAFGDTFACVMGKVWLARNKRKAAWISHEACGCMGGGYYTGLYAPYMETIAHYVSTGIPGTPFDGEHYLPSPQTMRAFLEDCAPPPATGKYCVFKPLEAFAPGEEPLVIVFFARPEVINGLHSLTCYAAGSHLAVVSPFSAACGSMVAWPLVYQQRGEERAVLGGFDLSARKFLKTDEMLFSIPLPFYRKMLDVMEASALTRHTWQGVLKKVRKSNQTWARDARQPA
ncbi:DUF169 domain-containing protein [Solidesulfovibrio sp.]|uniref:DUF169 domain-containing protein n=1 Tax=Solidesulfovibrio sp. TaxID=2910990 RepID=UPI00261615B8|nr:DUF169 domain-containing protein [Solidesulfovibrio sp.]